MKLEYFPRQKSSIGYWPAKYPALILYGLVAILLLLPSLNRLAWVLAFVFLFKEKDSFYLRLHCANTAIVLFFQAMLCILLDLLSDFLLRRARQSQSDSAYIRALLQGEYLSRIDFGLRLLVLFFFLFQAYFAYRYAYLHLKPLSGLAKKLERLTSPGPIR